MESEIEAIKAEYATMPPAEEEERVIKLVLNAGLLSLKIRSLTKENKKLKASLLAAQNGSDGYVQDRTAQQTTITATTQQESEPPRLLHVDLDEQIALNQNTQI